MLGLILIYFIGRAFYSLAFDYKRNKWLFAVLGVLSYYAGTFIAGLVIGIIALFSRNDFTETLPNIVLSLIGLPVGLLSCWIFYKILMNVWERKESLVISESLDGNLVRNN